MKEIAIGIDIGGTNTVAGFVDRSGNILGTVSMHTDTFDKVDSYLEELVKKLKNKLIEILTSDITLCGIGIGAPNGNYYKGTIEHAPNLNFKGVIPLASMIKAHFGVHTVLLTNDANAAALGEMVYGGARGLDDFIMVTLGTGVGSGIVSNGKLILGHDGFAGEFGHTTAIPGGRQCACGRQGCVETYASAKGIQRTVYEIIANSISESGLRDIPFNSLTAKTIHDYAMKGDSIALEAFEKTGLILGRALADAVAYTSPSCIFLFGGLAEAGPLLFEPTKRHMESHLLPIFRNKIKILPSALPGAEAAILGASALVWNSMDS